MTLQILMLAAAIAAPDGNEWQDPSRQFLNRLPVSTLTAPADALDLSGVDAWRFKWTRRPSERPVGFEKPGYDVSSWDLVTVPCSWQACGIRSSGERFGVPIYVNQPYTFTPRRPLNKDCPPKVIGNDLPKDWTFSNLDNPVGSYRRDFDLPADWLDASKDVFIRLEGVESFYYLWINGNYVGFAKDSRSPSVYDVTKYVKAGRNTVAVEVYRYCDGSYLECQDIFRLSGILRPVRVCALKKDAVKDVRFEAHPEKKGVYDGDWILAVTTTPAEYAGTAECTLPLEPLGNGRYRARKPKLWSAETPNLYKLTVAGRVFNLGFREVEITEPANPRDRTFLVNGRPVKLKGVNRTEVDPVYGHHCPTAVLRKDLELIKKGNFNHVRNSHCPQPDEFYDLCDELGVYVMDEANLESHGIGYDAVTSLSARPEWLEAHLYRERNMIDRNRNHACIVMWSQGNEAGPGKNFKVCYEWMHGTDPTRPINNERNWDCADVGARQYPSLYWLQEAAAGRENVKYPFHVNEFLHNLNNNAGGVKHFQDAIESSDRILGSALWDFADQGLKKKVGDKYIYAFGGDFGEKPSEGQGILDGIVHADRTVEPSYLETRHAYQPFDTRLAKDGRSIVIESKYFFRDSSAYEMRVNGRLFALDPIRPREKRVVPLSSIVPSAPSPTGAVRDPYLLVEFVQKEQEGVYEKGWVIASDQIKLPDTSNCEHASCVKYEQPEKTAVFTETDADYVFAAGDYRYRFSKATGSFVSIEKNGAELLEKPVFVDAFRGPVGGDMALGDDRGSRGARWARAGLANLKPRLKKLTKVTKLGRGLRFATIVDWRGASRQELIHAGLCDPHLEDAGEVDADAPGYHVASEYVFFGDGSVQIGAAFKQFGAPTEVPRLGLRFVFRGAGMQVDYKARGPWDNYVDRCLSTFVGTYSAKVHDLIEYYGRTCDYGNRTEAYAVRLDRPALTFAALYQPLAAFQVAEYSPMELYLNPHPEILPEPGKTELGLYAVQGGLGSSNCGPLPETEFRVDSAKTYQFEFLMTPEKTLDKRTFYEPYGVAPVNFDAAKGGPAKLPSLEGMTREKILDVFAKDMYGEEPPAPKEWMFYPGDTKTILGGKAVVRTGRMRFCSETDFWRFDGSLPDVRPIEWMIVKPAKHEGKCPVIVFLNYRGNHEYVPDAVTSPTGGWVRNNLSLFIVDHHASELTRGKHADPSDATYLPLAELIDRGYAIVTACYADFCPDSCVNVQFRTGDEEKTCFEGTEEFGGPVFLWWGKRDPKRTDNVTALGAWAWGLSRGLDLAASDPDLDATRSIVTGCSRLGKAALLAGARDTRFAVVAPVQTGGGGVPLLKHDYGENAALMNLAFPHWYCEAFRKYSNNEAAMPFDQHMLLAAVAPRKLLVNGFDAPMYDPEGERMSVDAARPMWKKLGDERNLRYRRRSGRHGIAYEDWRAILDFAESK